MCLQCQTSGRLFAFCLFRLRPMRKCSMTTPSQYRKWTRNWFRSSTKWLGWSPSSRSWLPMSVIVSLPIRLLIYRLIGILKLIVFVFVLFLFFIVGYFFRFALFSFSSFYLFSFRKRKDSYLMQKWPMTLKRYVIQNLDMKKTAFFIRKHRYCYGVSVSKTWYIP